MFLIPHLVKAVRSAMRRNVAPAAEPVPAPNLPKPPPVVRFGPRSSGAQNDPVPGRRAGEVLDEVLAHLRHRKRFPLVTINDLPCAKNGFRVGVAFFEDGDDIPAVEFYVADERGALEWIRHLAEKTWVTKEHLEIFASLMHEKFAPPSRAA